MKFIQGNKPKGDTSTVQGGVNMKTGVKRVQHTERIGNAKRNYYTYGDEPAKPFNPTGETRNDGSLVGSTPNSVNPNPLSQITPQINTSQPSPQNVNATPFTNPNTPSVIPNASPALAPTPTQTTQPQPSPYQQGLSNAQASGVPAPQTSGNVSNYMPQPKQANPLEAQIQNDPGMQMLFKGYADYMHTINQRKSLVQEYSSLSKKLGIESLDTEIMNAKNVIEGTEDDIRNEVTKAGGFATDSQVLALSNARNKVLIKNYNNLLDTRNNAQQTLTTMIGLAQQDRQAADQAFNMQMNFTSQIMNYRDKFITNAQNSLQNTIKAIGYDGIYQNALNTGDPTAVGRIEQTLGMPQGSLASASQQAIKDKQYQQTKDNLSLDLMRSNLATDSLQRRNIQSQIDERSAVGNTYGTIDGKPQNQNQATANSYANRLNEADVILGTLGQKFTGKLSMIPSPNFLKSGDRQAYEQAQNNFVTAVLRRESGASIAPTEFETARKTYFPQPGDKETTLKQKETARNTVINNFYREANVNRPVLPGMVIQSNGVRYRVGADGETLTQI